MYLSLQTLHIRPGVRQTERTELKDAPAPLLFVRVSFFVNHATVGRSELDSRLTNFIVESQHHQPKQMKRGGNDPTDPTQLSQNDWGGCQGS
mmetsp:Transcript_14910/g.24673  ORF Transcript_14910/g.24673 Transcript_14910/m.24673 type:complete len:92 (+) Transcript_14910:1720-1995(+)